MSLAAGTRIGPYEIAAPIGAGGMGEVYRARDTRLDRDVAIKILPPAFASDTDRLARFEREARTLASLNHPNIAQIYGLENSGDGTALVMELVAGDELSALIARGPLALDEAVAIAKQIADALEAAHEAGVVHRDLKPANIKVRADGTVKVLDFGLAKPSSDGSSAPSLMNSPTMTSPAMTAMGVILGTAGYMAPEQARGKPVDKRSDIWAFGVVLYEMVSGATLFGGDTVSDVLAAVLRADVDMAALPKTVPPGMRRLIARCLEKDPWRRLRDIGEARIWLETPVADGAAPARTRAWPVVAAAGGIAAVMLAGWTALAPRELAAPVRASIMLPPGTEYLLDTANPPNLAMSPDGSLIAFSAIPIGGTVDNAATLYVRRLSDGAMTAIPDSAGGRVPVFSPDSRWIAFLTGSVLKKASVSGGAPTTLANGITNIWGSDWLADGTIVYSHPQPGGEMLYAVSDQGGTPSLLTRVDRLDEDNSFPRAAGSGALIVTHWTGGMYHDGRISRYSMKSRAWDPLVQGGSQGEVVGGRHLVYARGGELFAQPYSARSGPSASVKVLDGVLTDLSYGTSQFDVSAAGSLVYAPAPVTAPSAWVVWLSADGRTETLFEDARIEMPRLSGNGRHLVYMSTQGAREKDLWAFNLDARRLARLTNVRGEEYGPAISHDGAFVYFPAWRETWGFYRASTLGGGEVRLAPPMKRAFRGYSVSGDGRWLAVTDDVPGGAFDRLGSDVGVIDLTSKTMEPRWLTSAPSREDQPAFSPDGSRIAYVSNQLGRADIWVMAFPQKDGEQPAPVSREGGLNPFWSMDGRTLYFTGGGALMASPVDAGGRFGEPRKVLDLPNLTVIGAGPDGRFLAVRRTREPITRLEVFLNWLQVLDQRSGG
ncbi:MAG TPA: protein kinase [Vicinamibacterales bacterium]|nr:protein kinase [Vicinamibacterales bacterium]